MVLVFYKEKILFIIVYLCIVKENWNNLKNFYFKRKI
jgi:hypothetical protein